MIRFLMIAISFLPVTLLAKTAPVSKRILTLGIRNESNTFSTAPTRLSDFQVKRGKAVLKDVEWAAIAASAGVQLIPTLHAYAWPGGVVEKKAFDLFKAEILDSIRKSGHLDGIFMEMHGALHVEGYEDAQATLIKEIRGIVGNAVLISASFDLHGNLSPAFVSGLNLLTAYRTAPHRDVEETKSRAVRLLIKAIDENLRPVMECVTIPILVPGEKSITDKLPLKPIYDQLPVVSAKSGLLDASVFAGYCWADLPRSAMRVFVLARDSSYRALARKEAQALAGQIWKARTAMQLSVPSGTFDEMLTLANKSDAKTVFISDAGDNTTAGAPGDNTYVLERLLAQNQKNILLGGIVDPQAFDACMARQLNDTIALTLGAKIDNRFSHPVRITGKLLSKSNDAAIADKRGAVVLDVNGIRTVILRDRRSLKERRDFADLSLDPLSFKIVIVKLGYLFPELNEIAPLQLMALTQGFCNLDIAHLPYKQVTRPAYPLDETMEWDPANETKEDYGLSYEGKAATALVGDGKFIVKTAPEHFVAARGMKMNGRLRFYRQGEEVLPASTLWNTVVFPGGARYSIRLGRDSVTVTYGVPAGPGFTVAVDAPISISPILEMEAGTKLEEKRRRNGDRYFTSFSQKAATFMASDPAAFQSQLEQVYRSKLVVQTPLPTLNKAVAFSQELLDLSYNGDLMYCELFRWLDIWARDLGSGLLPGALISGRGVMARQSLVYDLNRYAGMSPSDCKNSNDPSQGGTASEVGWTVRSVWNYYTWSGNLDSLRKDAAIIRPWVTFWMSRDYDDDGLITDVTDFMDHMIMMLSTNGVRTLASNSMYASLLLYASRIEEALGNKKLAEELDHRYQRTVNALNTIFWNDDKGYFSNMTLWDGVCRRSSQASQSMLLKIGATDAARTRRTLDYLRQNNWCRAGSITITPRMNHVDMDNDQNVKVWPWWNLWEAEARFQNGDPGGGLHLLQLAAATIEDEKYPGLIEETLDTTGVSTGGNLFVTAAGNLLETVIKDLFGVEPARPGWLEVKVMPAVPSSWTTYSCRIPTPGGFISLDCREGKLHITVADPRIKNIWVRPGDNSVVNGAIRQEWRAPQPKTTTPYTSVSRQQPAPLKKGRSVLFYDASFHPQQPALDMETINLSQLESLNAQGHPKLVITGNMLPLHTLSGKPVKDLLDRYVQQGGTIICYGARTHPKTEEDGAGILGEQHGIIDWYDFLSLRKTIPLQGWTFQPAEQNPDGARRDGVYTCTVSPDAAFSGSDIYLELGPLAGRDSVFINGQLVATYRDMEAFIRQEYPTRTPYPDTHRYKMLSRYYMIKAGSPAYRAIQFGATNKVEVKMQGDGLNLGIPESNHPSLGIMTDKRQWQPLDEALPGIGLANPKRKGVNYWGNEQFFNSWSTKHGLFGFSVKGKGVQFMPGTVLAELPDTPLIVNDIYTDFAVFKPWNFEVLAYTGTQESLLYPEKTERYPCIARIAHNASGGGFILIAPAIADSPLGPEVLKKISGR
ncbi:M81 family metallopeptidase [Flavihumibacter petaseus]|uniref:Uncharacterized protein n=1 Tax=Flavihumibacter petaseus NBRC 106054 TaxID=1220578 RepID=A0A0E9N0K8_9BACT|nr:M81 family metallopeptidase [Flavihumibacter petaseus]GAO43364.1 hypothetical protein FPE01S_02_04690 [Flavihumibacter petaseus NBRC 106054]